MFKGIIKNLAPEDRDEVEDIFDLYWSDEFRKGLTKKLDEYTESNSKLKEQGFTFLVAKENGEVVGIAAYRKVPEHMSKFVKTEKAVEFYVSAAKYKNRGIGSALRAKRIEEAKKLGFTEAVFFSGETHKDSWGFHDKSDFKRVGRAVAPNGEVGQVWGMLLK